MSKPNFELLKDAYEIIDGIPEENIHLDNWRSRDEGKSCGTIACTIGWLTLHPKFQALGLHYDTSRAGPDMIAVGNERGFQVIEKLFGLNFNDAWKLFGPAHTFKSHKPIALGRIREFLREHGQLKEQIEQRKHQRAVAQRALSR
jgi:hypothetical protein